MRQVGKISDEAGLTFDKTFIERCLSKALGLDASTGDISVTTTKKGITVVPHFPSVVIVDMGFYEKVYEVLSQICYPFYTVLKPSGVTTKKSKAGKNRMTALISWSMSPLPRVACTSLGLRVRLRALSSRTLATGRFMPRLVLPVLSSSALFLLWTLA